MRRSRSRTATVTTTTSLQPQELPYYCCGSRLHPQRQRDGDLLTTPHNESQGPQLHTVTSAHMSPTEQRAAAPFHHTPQTPTPKEGRTKWSPLRARAPQRSVPSTPWSLSPPFWFGFSRKENRKQKKVLLHPYNEEILFCTRQLTGKHC